MKRLLVVALLFVAAPCFAQSSLEPNKARAMKIFDCISKRVPCSRPTEEGPMGGWVLRDEAGEMVFVVYVCEKSCEFKKPELSFDIVTKEDGTPTVRDFVTDVGPSGEVQGSGASTIDSSRYEAVLRKAERLLFPKETSRCE